MGKLIVGVIVGVLLAVGYLHNVYTSDGVAFGETMQRAEQAKRIADQTLTKARTEAKRAAKAYAEDK